MIDDKLDVTAIVPTKDRYFTTLLATLQSIAMQTHKPKKIILYDDGEKIDLRQYNAFSYMFKTLDRYGIKWEVKFGDGRGQAILHDRSIADSDTEFIWRIDDDCIAEPDVLFKLHRALELMGPTGGAVGGIVAEPDRLLPCPSFLNGTMDDVYLGQNIQWYASANDRFVEHLYSSFLYRKSAAVHGYRNDLSPASHREETIFTHQMHRNGWKLRFVPSAITWHYRNPDGGIRKSPGQHFANDERVFMNIMQNEWKIPGLKPIFVVLDNGIGDHYAFKHALDEMKVKYHDRRIIIACCYPGVFELYGGIEITSIHDASLAFDIEQYNIYAFMDTHNWEDAKLNLVDAFKILYLHE